MSQPDDILFKLKTEGDTSGAEEVEKSIFAAEDAAKTAGRQADADLIRQKQALEVQKQQAQSLQEIAELNQRIVAAGLASGISKTAAQFQGLSSEIDLCINSATNFLNVFATTGDPIKATMAVAVTAIGDVVKAYIQAGEQTKALTKGEQEDMKKLADLRRSFAAQLRAEGVAAIFQSEANAMDKQADAVERAARVNKAKREADAGTQDSFGPAVTGVDKINQDLARSIAEVDFRVVTATQAAKLALDQATLANTQADRSRQTSGEDDPETKRLVGAAQSAARAAETSASQAAEIAATAEADKQKLVNLANEKTKELLATSEDVITKNAEQVRDTIAKLAEDKAAEAAEKVKAIAAAGGDAAAQSAATAKGELEADIKGQFKVITDLLKDSIPDAQQTAEFAQAMRIAAGSRDAVNADLAAYFRENAAFQQTFTALVKSFINEMADLKGQLQQATRR